ncbi:MAG: elongation factor 4 [Candidatus Taylorbacteria bacterium RIFCSPLOWO2_01_FULL_43_44]|uniref:Elongation factor 4 n=1 Tax=Candidatus Taylorbacteria bacterium RIFCSPHIGHO2_02_FULL_43_32b TaxID=1802306 RepID=A0A1G2MIZ1_9BACT|nr:MAG: elongation factor 4 [Candidatus Taylorbacteria bacterium RIFCSPHIGHO2_01_FULL_43_47]OHA23900.1 MAG: elongation factor 4 [Candidatus Taylorbacteria bacterium RIFCSPHIGHO2_02_FULL_43_32b]OHA30651.1 MAG: elongation factor 4 [Candidatus Taylorbacteria bacterium RIFCSPLOWO2_01_FULL_43_44]
MLKNIRNFSIIAHIDHGKSTLADRMLEITGTIEKRKMQEQVLDSMELERERGITIKMTPVRMNYTLNAERYTLNLIDTPGHIDFSYEVSRSLKAVEGAILLVDATQGVQAQTLTTLQMAKEVGIVILPVISKIDSPLARVDEVRLELAKLLDCNESQVLSVSGKTGEGVEGLLKAVVERVPPPIEEYPSTDSFRGLVFDFQYSNHTGVIVYVRVFDGEVTKKDTLYLTAVKEKFTPIEVGIFTPDQVQVEKLSKGETGYIVTGIKRPGIASVGDTITIAKKPLPALPGYMTPKPVVWASIYPENQSIGGGKTGGDDWNLLRQALERLRLSDSSFTFEEESSGVLGRGFRCGFLGMLHLEIITERLRREFGLKLIITTPSIRYEVLDTRKKMSAIYSPALFPEYGFVEKVFEPWVSIRIITPPEYIGAILKSLYEHEAEVGETGNWSAHRTQLDATMPLRELMRCFFDELKSISSGFASLSYFILPGNREANVVRLDVLVADEIVPAFTRIVSERRVEEESKKAVEKLHDILPKQLFTIKIQAKAMGRIIASRAISALKKDVAGYLSGGDRSRKMKLWKQQKEGKKRLKSRGTVDIPQDVFVKMMQSD